MLSVMLTRQQIEERADYFGRLLELHIRAGYEMNNVNSPDYNPNKIARNLGVLPEEARRDFIELNEYLDELERVGLEVLEPLKYETDTKRRNEILERYGELDSKSDIIWDVLRLPERFNWRVSEKGDRFLSK